MNDITGIPLRAPGALSAEEQVFGVGFKRDANGKPIEQGHGALGHETPQHKNALQRMQKLSEMGDGDREDLKKLLKELVQPPEDLTPEQRKAKDAKDAETKERESEQEKRIAGLEEMLLKQSKMIDKLLNPPTVAKNMTATEVLERMKSGKKNADEF